MSLPQARLGVLGSLLASLLVLGCGSTSGSPKDGGTGGSLGGAGGSSGGGIGGLGGAAGSGTAGAPMPTGSLVFQGDDAEAADAGAALHLGRGRDRRPLVCVRRRVGENPNNGDLFVVNVTKAAAGVSITCGPTDANCLKLTSSYGEDEIHPAMFQGDTLVYYDADRHALRMAAGDDRGRACSPSADPNTADVLAVHPEHSRGPRSSVCAICPMRCRPTRPSSSPTSWPGSSTTRPIRRSSASRR